MAVSGVSSPLSAVLRAMAMTSPTRLLVPAVRRLSCTPVGSSTVVNVSGIRSWSAPNVTYGTSVATRGLTSSHAVYARAKRARSKVEEQDQPYQSSPPPPEFGGHQPIVPSPAANQVTFEERMERSQLKTLEDKPTQKYVAKVFATTTSTIGVAAATSGVALATGLATTIPVWIGAVGIIPLVGFYFTNENTSPALRHTLLASFTGISGLSLAPILGVASMMDPTIIPLALGGTTLVMAGSAGAALVAPRASMLRMAPVLGGGALALIGLSMFGMGQYYMTGAVSPWLTSVHLYGGLGLAVAFTAYDTQNIIEEYRAGSRDYLRHSVDMFVNFLMIFRRMLALFMMRDD